MTEGKNAAFRNTKKSPSWIEMKRTGRNIRNAEYYFDRYSDHC